MGKKNFVLAGALCATMSFGLSMQAAVAWVKIKNKTPWNLKVWWYDHKKFNTKENALLLQKEQSVTLRLNEESMRGPFYIAPHDKNVYRTIYDGVIHKSMQSVTYTTPVNAPFFPIDRHGVFYRALTLTGKPKFNRPPNFYIKQIFPFSIKKKAGIQMKSDWQIPYGGIGGF